MKYWLMKSEPDAFSIDDLKAVSQEPWDGVRNYEARNFMRDQMRPGDQVLFYHSNAKPPGVVGIAEVASDSYPDPTQYDEESKYFDPKSTDEKPRWYLVDLQYVKHLPRQVSLQEIRDNAALEDIMLVKRSRLSVIPLKLEEFEEIVRMAEGVPA